MRQLHISAIVPARCAMLLRRLRPWIDGGATTGAGDDERIDWLRAVPFILLHVACVGVVWVGVSPVALIVATALYALRMFALTAFYHRYFSHRAFRTSRATQCVFAVIGASCVQRGPLWWAAHHRNHHRHTETDRDPHSPSVHGFLWSHAGWFLTPAAFRTDLEGVRDFSGYAELRWLDRYDTVVPAALAVALYALGAGLQAFRPAWGTSGPQMVVWGFCISTVALFHATATINSLAHRFGRRRFATRDDSRNNAWLALITFGEGWHNNHHYYPGAARQGFRWWEIDPTWYGLRLLAVAGLVWDLKPVPDWVLRKVEH